jgi:hypothetical protein
MSSESAKCWILRSHLSRECYRSINKSGKPIAITTHLAVRSIIRSGNRRSFCLGSCKLVFRTVVMFSAWRVKFSAKPVSPGDREIWVGSLGGVADSGTIKTVIARGWLLRASIETTTTGRPPLSGGSLGNFTYQISPRCGGLVGCVTMSVRTVFPKTFPSSFLLPLLHRTASHNRR